MIKVSPLDRLFSRFIKLLSGGYCTRCKKFFGINSRGLQCAHFHSRRKQSVRFDRDNATALCTGCHFFLDGRPLEKTEFFLELLGQDKFNALWERAKTLYPKPDLEQIKQDLKEKIKMLEG